MAVFRTDMRAQETRAAWGFLAPDLIGLLAFIILPILLALGMSFMSVSGFGAVHFVGLENFSRLVDDARLPRALMITFGYAALAVPLSYVVGLSLALLLEDKVKGGGLIRTMVFVPYVLSLVVVALIWEFLLVDKTGVVPTLLAPVGLGDISWLGDPRYALLSVVIITVWSQAGYQMLLFLGGLGGIPKDYYDAAAIDGAGWWRRLHSITLPMLRPTSFFIILTSAMGCITGAQAFDLVFMLTRGGPANATLTMPFYIYEQAFTYNDLGYAAALTLVLVAVLMIAVMLTFAMTRGARFHEGD
ncbi:MAG: sugar ABC transporter permease [Brachybacterium sp.]|nr:sugar ABC transporter permease [Brachybacterium sp.]